MCSFHLFPFSSLQATLCLSLNQTRRERASSDCLATSNTHQTKNREKRRGTATIPRPSFTNYSEYLLTGGLSLCLLSHPTPLIFPLQHPPSFSVPLCYSLPCGAERNLLAPPSLEETREKEDMEEDSGEFIFKTQALIWETLQGGVEGAIDCSLEEPLRASGRNSKKSFIS